MNFFVTIFLRAKSHLTSAIQWWGVELKSAFPWIETILVDPQPRALVLDENERVTLVLMDLNSELRRETFETRLDQFSPEQGARLADLCAERELSVSVASSEVHCLQLVLPKTATGNVRQSIRYRLLTDSPLESDSMVFDVRPLNTVSNQTVVPFEVALCRRQSVDRLKLLAEKLGLISPHIGLSRDDGIDLAFVFEHARGADTASARMHRNMLLALAPLCICVLVLLIGWSCASWKEAALRKNIATLSGRTDESVRLLARQTYVRATNKAMNDDLSKAAISQVLNDISKTMPQSAWISELRIEGGKLRMVGSGTDPAAIAHSIAVTPSLTAVRLDSVNAAAVATGSARFEITAEIANGEKK